MDQLTQIIDSFKEFDSYRPERLGFAAAIDAAMDIGPSLYAEVIGKVASFEELSDEEVGPSASSGNKFIRALGAVGQLWKAKEFKFPQKPSTLGQLLTLGSMGALAGYGAGGVADWLVPGNETRFRHLGALAGGTAGLIPGIAGGVMNHYSGQPVMMSSFWDFPDRKKASFAVGDNCNWELGYKRGSMINVNEFNRMLWNDPSMASSLPPTYQAAASGLITGASNLPGKVRNSPFVSPLDVARMAVGMGSDAVSGWLVGKALGAAMGLSDKNRDILIRTGGMAGLIKQVVPMAFPGLN